jgi:hypothetical protein
MSCSRVLLAVVLLLLIASTSYDLIVCRRSAGNKRKGGHSPPEGAWVHMYWVSGVQYWCCNSSSSKSYP